MECFLFVVQWRSAHLVDKKKIFHTGCLSGETPWCELQIGAKANKFTLFNSECSDFGNQLQRDITLHTARLCARLLREEKFLIVLWPASRDAPISFVAFPKPQDLNFSPNTVRDGSNYDFPFLPSGEGGVAIDTGNRETAVACGIPG